MSAAFHQPAIVGRSCVDTHAAAVRPARGRHEAFAVALEPEHAIGEHVGGGEALAQAFRHGAEVLADDEALRALALERERAEQIVERIAT